MTDLAPSGNPLAGAIGDLVVKAAAEHPGRTRYRTPLWGFAPAEHADFARLAGEFVPGHLLPRDLLPGARSVVSFFLPFHPEVVRANVAAQPCAEQWVVAYVETNLLISRVCEELENLIREHGYRAAWAPPTYNYDAARLVATWSHKSVARIAGLGDFGPHRMLITPAGCAGRFGSLVTDADLPFTAGRLPPVCLRYAGRKCRVCMERCPAGAIGEDGTFDRFACNRRLEEISRHWSATHGDKTHVCGKCATGPCALAIPPSGRFGPTGQAVPARAVGGVQAGRGHLASDAEAHPERNPAYFRSRFSTLPLGVRGRVSANSITCGSL